MSDARAVLLRGLLDYAGLFPPASLGVADAVGQFARVRAHQHGALVERLVAPAERVEAVGEAAAGAADLPWAVTLVVDAPALRAAAEAAGRVTTALRVEAVELRPLPSGDVAGAVEAARAVFPGAEVVAEVAPADDAALDALAGVDAGAKLRCGGARVPSVDEVAGLLRGCARRGVPVKATAGLHHAVAGEADGAWRHGFLNLLAAAALDGEEAALRETDPAAFSLGADGFAWRARRLDPAHARARLTGIGSCSFDEPLEELEALGVLAPAGAPA